MSAAALAMSAPTITSVQPVAQAGMEAKIGAKKTDMKKASPVMQDVSPVLPPSEMPAPDSTKAVTGGLPRREPMEMEIASTIWVALAEGEGSWGWVVGTYVCYGAAFEVLGAFVDGAGKAGHRVQCACCVEDVDVLFNASAW